ncbi:MAG: hypothetical protein EBZ47_10405, partial [Chlamydiae bacterium]|nr:hypothetical protein [Chlamydiota bacterium]
PETTTKKKAIPQVLRKDENKEIAKRINYLLLLSRVDPAQFSQLREEDVNSKHLSVLVLEPLSKDGFIQKDATPDDKVVIAETLSSFRNESAFFAYVSLFKGNTEMTKAIQTMIDWIAKGQFKSSRHENNPHNGSLTAHEKHKWEEGISEEITLKGKKYQVVDTEEAEDLLLCGTEVDGSCQRVDADANYNRCLMGYVLDGKIRLIAVKDDKGKIISRAIIKLLLTEDNKPALFFEEIYGGNAYEKDLKSLAKAKAKSMGVPIFESQPVGIILHSEGSPAPFEYEDGNSGVTIGGIYRVNAQYLL